MNIPKTAVLALVSILGASILGTACGVSQGTDRDAGAGLDPAVETFSAALGAGWSASSTSTAATLEEYVEASDAVVQARLIGVSVGPALPVDEQPGSPTISFVYVRFRPMDTLTGSLRPDAAGEIRIEYPKPPGITAAGLEALIPGEPSAVLFIADPRTAMPQFEVPHVYLAAGVSGVVVEGDSQGSPLVALANDEAADADAAFGYETLAELRDAIGAIAVTTEDRSTLPTDSGTPGPLEPDSGGTRHVFE